jgi:cytochrome P450
MLDRTISGGDVSMAAVSLRELRSEAGRRDPYRCYARMHGHGGVSRLDVAEDRYDAVVYGYDAVDQVLRDPRLRVTDARRLDQYRPEWRDHPSLYTLVTSMFFTNGAEHARVRRRFGEAFTARRVASLAGPVAQLTGDLLDRLARAGQGGTPVDFMAEFAFALPSTVIGELLGVPEEDQAWFRPRVLSIGKVLELGGSTEANLAVADAAAIELTDYFAALVARREREPRDDLISALVHAPADGTGRLDGPPLLANLVTVFNAGFVTTTHLLANGLTLLLDHPDQLAALRRDPGLIDRYVDEILRFEPPTHFVVRYAAAEVEVAGVVVPAGASVLVLLGAANRDPGRFPDPDVFRPTRDDGASLTFGAGPHFCLGAPLTRLEGQVALPMLLDRFPGVALAEPPPARDQLMLRGYDRLMVTLG